MAKILLVEDDKSLREIYGVRLSAEGYEIITASDGEQALAVAIKEKPALIISDVMMPKISGFDMLDILRSTAETKNIRVIMMTALSSDDQRQRGEQMGADRYLVKSQVGIEDVVRTVHEVLGDKPSAPATPPTPPAAPTPPPSTPTPPAAPTEPPATVPPPAPTPTATVTDDSAKPPMPAATSSTPPPPSNRQRIIQPISDPTEKVDINLLLSREMAKEAGQGLPTPAEPAPTIAQEQAAVQDQVDKAMQPTPPPAAPVTDIAPPGPQPMQQPRQASPASVPARPLTPLQTPRRVDGFSAPPRAA